MAIMIEGEDGEYYLQAGAILVPGMFCLLLRLTLIDRLVRIRRNVAVGR